MVLGHCLKRTALGSEAELAVHGAPQLAGHADGVPGETGPGDTPGSQASLELGLGAPGRVAPTLLRPSAPHCTPGASLRAGVVRAPCAVVAGETSWDSCLPWGQGAPGVLYSEVRVNSPVQGAAGGPVSRVFGGVGPFPRAGAGSRGVPEREECGMADCLNEALAAVGAVAELEQDLGRQGRGGREGKA